MKILTVVGTRPQFIKASVLSPELANQGCVECLVHTGQHYDYNMSKVFFDGLELKEPDYYLEVGSASHAVQTANMMARFEPVVQSEQPDWVVVYGDTNTTLAGALVAAKLGKPLAHVEAGLRSFNRHMPEEINRIVADHVATTHLAPTITSVENLASEGIARDVHLVGDLMVDLVNLTLLNIPERPSVLQRFDLVPGTFGVATIHRAANTDDRRTFEAILEGLRRIGFPIIFSVHPRTLPLFRTARAFLKTNILECEPLAYRDMIALLARARVIVTDSGGIQKEALALRVPCVTLRSETEWVETLESGWNVLAGVDPALIASAAKRARPSVDPRSHYGDGKTAKRIAEILLTRSSLRKAIA
jgi:UDP-N-acetylglucosamine 2-epimerase